MKCAVFIGAALLSTGAIAEAGTLATPTSLSLTSPTAVACYIRNVGKKSIPITATINSSGTVVVPTFQNCNAAPLAAGATCIVSTGNCPYCGCVVTSEKSVKNLRGTLEYRRFDASPGLRVMEAVDLQ